MTLVYYRRKPHTALDPSINKGKLRFKRITKRNRTTRGPARVVVSFQGDLEEIDAFRKEQKRRASEAKVTEGHLPISGLAAKLGLKTRNQKRSLGFALQMFHSEHPSASQVVLLWDDKTNRAVETSHYDVVRFLAWMDGRDVVELLKERNDRPQRNEQRHAKRLAKANSFLKVLLTEGPVDGTEVKRAASKAGVAKKTLWESKKSLGVKSFSTAFQGPSYWRLPEEVASGNGNEVAIDESIEQQESPPAEADTLPTAPPVDPATKKRRGGGRPLTEERKAVRALCYELHQNQRELTLAVIKSRVNHLIGKGRRLVRQATHVTTEAHRHAKANNLPFSPRN